jgi:hypothetical protein
MPETVNNKLDKDSNNNIDDSEVEEVWNLYSELILKIVKQLKPVICKNCSKNIRLINSFKKSWLEAKQEETLLEKSDLTDQELVLLQELSIKADKSYRLIVTQAIKHYLTVF